MAATSRRSDHYVISDIQHQLGQAVCEAIGLSNSKYVHCDVTNEEDIKNVVDIAVAPFGKLDIMFNNAGIVDPYKERVIDNEKPDFERVLNLNVIGVFLGMKHAARVMVPARSGSIISMASVASNIGGAATHAYTCAKHAVTGLTKSLAVELGQFSIRVNCLLEGKVALITGKASDIEECSAKLFAEHGAKIVIADIQDQLDQAVWMKHAARVMVPAQTGSIISMASVASIIGGVATHAYTCAKHDVTGLTKSLAVELGQFNIRVNCLSPYAIATPMATSFLGLDKEYVENKVNFLANLKVGYVPYHAIA
ncbi:hypothetical protein L1987_84190 [Smallanthus sonchifolius]|uniref:Uncharacterized protein n=1 Tax=Smallanthus sonchifolius TaxID=185202 RepID=A0ACB8YE76_9ASTR|nr:hypothetical protein L1987_84190 [Smallanthus sonchifolius]